MPLPVVVSTGPAGGDSRARALVCVQAYALLHGLERPPALTEGPHGKPETGGGLHLSVSHSGAVWACAVHTAPVGLDIQQHRPGHDETGIAKRWFTPEEQGFLREHPEQFFDLWCAKEAWVKYTGLGLARGFKVASLVMNGALLSALEGAQRTRLGLAKGYTACLWHQAGAEIVTTK